MYMHYFNLDDGLQRINLVPMATSDETRINEPSAMRTNYSVCQLCSRRKEHIRTTLYAVVVYLPRTRVTSLDS